MREIRGDLFDQKTDAIVITTNGAVRKDGAAVMGRGVALQATRRWSEIAWVLGGSLSLHGNHVALLGQPTSGSTGYWVVSFPVKHHWRQAADLELISRSVQELIALADKHGWRTVALPRPGCGNGGLDWEIVRPLLEHERVGLDARFVVVNNEGSR